MNQDHFLLRLSWTLSNRHMSQEIAPIDYRKQEIKKTMTCTVIVKHKSATRTGLVDSHVVVLESEDDLCTFTELVHKFEPDAEVSVDAVDAVDAVDGSLESTTNLTSFSNISIIPSWLWQVTVLMGNVFKYVFFTRRQVPLVTSPVADATEGTSVIDTVTVPTAQTAPVAQASSPHHATAAAEISLDKLILEQDIGASSLSLSQPADPTDPTDPTDPADTNDPTPTTDSTDSLDPLDPIDPTHPKVVDPTAGWDKWDQSLSTDKNINNINIMKELKLRPFTESAVVEAPAPAPAPTRGLLTHLHGATEIGNLIDSNDLNNYPMQNYALEECKYGSYQFKDALRFISPPAFQTIETTPMPATWPTLLNENVRGEDKSGLSYNIHNIQNINDKADQKDTAWLVLFKKSDGQYYNTIIDDPHMLTMLIKHGNDGSSGSVATKNNNTLAFLPSVYIVHVHEFTSVPETHALISALLSFPSDATTLISRIRGISDVMRLNSPNYKKGDDESSFITSPARFWVSQSHVSKAKPALAADVNAFLIRGTRFSLSPISVRDLYWMILCKSRHHEVVIRNDIKQFVEVLTEAGVVVRGDDVYLSIVCDDAAFNTWDWQPLNSILAVNSLAESSARQNKYHDLRALPACDFKAVSLWNNPR